MYVERYYNWFLTINEGACCYSNIDNILSEIRCLYAYIYHNADDVVNNNHIHLVIQFENARTFKQVQKLFFGSHIKRCIYLCKAHQYLIHENDKDKRQFSLSDIYTNIDDLKPYFDMQDVPLFSFDDFKKRIENGSCKNIVDACSIYGVKQVCKYRCLINDILNFYDRKFEMVTNISSVYKQKYDDILLENQRLKSCFDDLQSKFYDLKKKVVDK